ncbi:hypothetical protein OSTOST_02759 [Ostertagia ostertagi]
MAMAPKNMKVFTMLMSRDDTCVTDIMDGITGDSMCTYHSCIKASPYYPWADFHRDSSGLHPHRLSGNSGLAVNTINTRQRLNRRANRLGCLRGFDLPADKLAPLRSVLPSPRRVELLATTPADYFNRRCSAPCSILDPEVELLATTPADYFNRRCSAPYFNTRILRSDFRGSSSRVGTDDATCHPIEERRPVLNYSSILPDQ